MKTEWKAVIKDIFGDIRNQFDNFVYLAAQ